MNASHAYKMLTGEKQTWKLTICFCSKTYTQVALSYFKYPPIYLQLLLRFVSILTIPYTCVSHAIVFTALLAHTTGKNETLLQLS